MPASSSRRSFLKSAAALAGSAALPRAHAASAKAPLMAYVGTYSSPIGKHLPTQVDLPPGNGKGIHIFQVDRTTGALSESGIVEMGTSPCAAVINAAGDRLYSTNETDRVDGTDNGS